MMSTDLYTYPKICELNPRPLVRWINVILAPSNQRWVSQMLLTWLKWDFVLPTNRSGRLVSSKMHDCTAQHNSISIKVYFLEIVAPLLLALALFLLRSFWEVAPLNINLNGEIQRDEVSFCEEIHMWCIQCIMLPQGRIASLWRGQVSG